MGVCQCLGGLVLLDLGPSAVHAALAPRLCRHWSQESAKTFVDELETRIAQGSTAAALGSWKALFMSAEANEHWAEKLILRNWPAKPSLALEVLKVVSDQHWIETIRVKALESQFEAGPVAAVDFAFNCRDMARLSVPSATKRPTAIPPPLVSWGSPNLRISTVVPNLQFEIAPMGDYHGLKLYIGDHSRRLPEWDAIKSLGAFLEAPSKATLGMYG